MSAGNPLFLEKITIRRGIERSSCERNSKGTRWMLSAQRGPAWWTYRSRHDAPAFDPERLCCSGLPRL